MSPLLGPFAPFRKSHHAIMAPPLPSATARGASWALAAVQTGLPFWSQPLASAPRDVTCCAYMSNGPLRLSLQTAMTPCAPSGTTETVGALPVAAFGEEQIAIPE